MADISPLVEKFGRKFEAGKVIFREGDSAREMFIIQTGNVRVTKTVHNSEHTIAELGKGDFFGEMAIVTNDKRFATAIALTKVEALAFTTDDLANLITKNAKVAFNIIEKLIQRLKNANINIKILLNSSKLSLIALMLLETPPSKPVTDGLALDETTARCIDRFNVLREEIDYYFDIFAKEGAIEIEQNVLRILDRPKLEKYISRAFDQD